MSTEFFTTEVWKRLKSAARDLTSPVYVAVAYFAQDAAKLLPLPAGSRLVVDASEHAVRSGQTCPADLLVLLNRGL